MATDGARLPGVTLRVLNTESGTYIEAISSDAGSFRVGNLPPGQYELEADLSGFEPRRISGIVLAGGASVSLDVRLEVATVREQVRVVGEARRDRLDIFEMRESRARDLGEALADLPGVSRVRKGAIANDVVMRGFQGKDVTMLIDGQRLDGACPGHMDPTAFHVDFAEVSRVEISKGPFDVKNQGGLAGIVNIVTERPQRGWHGSANATFGSSATVSSSAAASIGGEQWALLGGAAIRRADPYRNGVGGRLTDGAGYRPEIVAEVPAYDVWTGWGRVAIVPRPGATVQVSYTRQSADTIIYPYLQMDALFDNADRAGARFEMAGLQGGWDTLAVHAYFTRVDHWMTDEYRTSAVGKAREYSMGTRAKTAIAGGRAELQRGAFAFGVEVSRRNWITSTMLAGQNYAAQAAMPDVDIDVAGAFGTYSADVRDRWRLEAGARFDRAVSSADPELANTTLYTAYHGTTSTRAVDYLPTGYLRAGVRAGAGWTAMIGAGHSTRLPDQQERFYGLKRMGTDWLGNPDLSPSRNTGVDGELRFARGGVDAGVAVFAYRINDYIRVVNQARLFAVPGVMNTTARSYANVDAWSRGLEAHATAPLGGALFASADLSLVRSTISEQGLLDTDLPEIPPARLRVRLRYDRPRWNAAIEGVASARQEHVAADLREVPAAAFAAMNLLGGLRVRRLNIAAAIDNVFDTLYSEHLSFQRDPFRSGVPVYEPGRTASVSMSVRF
jgi:iron complex outermembrane receptor protein